MLIGTADSLMVAPNEPLRRSWFTFDIDSPIGSFPWGQQFAISDLPESLLANRSQAVSYKPFNSFVNYPGYREATAGDITLSMFETDPAYFFFRDWRTFIHPPGTSVPGLYQDIVGTGVIQVYSPTLGGGVPAVSHRFRLVNVWPSELRVGQLSRGSDGEVLQYFVRLEVEEVEEF